MLSIAKSREGSESGRRNEKVENNTQGINPKSVNKNQGESAKGLSFSQITVPGIYKNVQSDKDSSV